MHGARCAALLALSIFSSAEQVQAARADWNDGGGPGFGGPAARGSMSTTDRRELGPVAQASRDQVQRERDARCGCNSADAGQAGRAGF